MPILDKNISDGNSLADKFITRSLNNSLLRWATWKPIIGHRSLMYYVTLAYRCLMFSFSNEFSNFESWIYIRRAVLRLANTQILQKDFVVKNGRNIKKKQLMLIKVESESVLQLASSFTASETDFFFCEFHGFPFNFLKHFPMELVLACKFIWSNI